MPFDQVIDFSIIHKLGQEEKYTSAKEEYGLKVVAKDGADRKSAGEEILTNTIVIHFFPNSSDLKEGDHPKVNGKPIEELLTPDRRRRARRNRPAGRAVWGRVIIIEGHTDASMKGQVPVEAVKDLSLRRANAIKEALLKKYTDLDANRFNVDGVGRDRPVDPLNQTKNRRVEIKVLTAEKAN